MRSARNLSVDSDVVTRQGQTLSCVAVALAAALAAAWLLHARSPRPTAEPGHGGEDAFASGLLPREIVPKRGPQRWSRESASFRFVHLPKAPYRLEVRIRGHRGPVRVLVDEADVGEIPEGRFVGRFDLPRTRRPGEATVRLVATPFTVDPESVVRGALVERVKLDYASAGALPWEIPLFLGAAALLAWGAARVSGFGAGGATIASVLVTCAQTLLLWPDGLVRSEYSRELPVLVSWLVLGCAALATRLTAELRRLRAWSFAALCLAAFVQVIAATDPTMVVSDAVFHANKLERLARGDWYPTSTTQHAQPFRFPYGVSFYAALLPADAFGFDRVALVRAGAALAGFLGSVALLAGLVKTFQLTGVFAVAWLQILPQTFGIYSYGNLSNGFGQAATLAFLAWWLRGGRPAFVGVLLVVLVGTAHLSSAIVVASIVVAMATFDRQRPRAVVLALGCALAASYYAHFFGMMVDQAPRLLEGGGGGGGGAAAGFLRQAGLVLQSWGAPTLVACAIGAFAGGWERWPRGLVGYALGASALFVPAVVSPLEVRYVYALDAVAALLAVGAIESLWRAGGGRRVVALVLTAAQFGLATYVMAQAILYRYRV